MKIALINDKAQSSKNAVVYQVLKKVCDQYHFELYNYGVMNEEDEELSYVQASLMGAILLNSKAVDFVITGCGTGQGVMMALNSFPNVTCGLVENPLDAYLFGQINGGNAISIPLNKGFGLGSELNLEYIFEKIFAKPFLNGYPVERSEELKKNKQILDQLKNVTHTDFLSILKNIDQDLLKHTINKKKFREYFFQNTIDEEIKKYINTLY